MSKKIVFLADCLVTQKAGIHFYTKQFIERVIKQYPSHDYYIVLDRPYEQLNIDRQKVKEVIVKTNPRFPLHFRWRSFSGIPKAVNKINPDIVIEMAHFGPFRLKAGIERITFIHDLTPISHPQWHDKTSHRVHKTFMPGILSKAKYIICNSKSTKQNILNYKKIDADKILVSYPQLLSNSKNQQSKISDQKFFLSVGTIEPRKNYMTLIKAFELFAEKCTDVDLHIAGGKGWKSEDVYSYIKKSKQKDRIHLMGYLDNASLAKAYQNCEAFIFPSWFEGFGMPLLEAMQAKKTIIASDIDICREVCGDSALYFDNKSAEELAEMMEKVDGDIGLRGKMEVLSKERAGYFGGMGIGLEEVFG